MSEPLPCPECGAGEMVHVIDLCPLEDGLVMKRLPHFKCRLCDARFFDDAAMKHIEVQRAQLRLQHELKSGKGGET